LTKFGDAWSANFMCFGALQRSCIEVVQQSTVWGKYAHTLAWHSKNTRDMSQNNGPPRCGPCLWDFLFICGLFTHDEYSADWLSIHGYIVICTHFVIVNTNFTWLHLNIAVCAPLSKLVCEDWQF
jgi:hypothetical protein